MRPARIAEPASICPAEDQQRHLRSLSFGWRELRFHTEWGHGPKGWAISCDGELLDKHGELFSPIHDNEHVQRAGEWGTNVLV